MSKKTVAELDYHNDSALTAALFSATTAVVLAFLYGYTRIGFENPILPIIKTLSLSFFILFFPQGVRFLCRQACSSGWEHSWALSHAALSLIGVILLIVGGLVAAVFNIMPIILLTGFFLFAGAVVVFLRTDKLYRSFIFLLLAGLFSFFVFPWLNGFIHPLFEERVFNGTAHIDSLYHITIFNMIQTYGQPSTGLDGLPYLNYHYGSHWIFVQLSNLLGMGGVQFYQLAYPLIFIPFLINAFLLFSVNLKRYISSRDDSFLLLRGDWKFWGLLFVLFIIERHWGWVGVSKFHPMVSESFVVAVGFLFICFSLMLTIFFHPTIKSPINKSILIALWVILPLTIGIIGAVKMHAVLILLCVIAYLFIRLRLYRYLKYVISLSIIILLFMIEHKFFVTQDGFSVIKLWGETRYLPGKTPWEKFYTIYYIYFSYVWVFLIFKLNYLHVKTIGELKTAISNNHVLDIEILIGIFLAGLAPIFLLSATGSYILYFTAIPYWVAMTVYLAYLDKFVQVILIDKNSPVNKASIDLRYLVFVLLMIPVLLFVGKMSIKVIHIMDLHSASVKAQFTQMNSQKSKLYSSLKTLSKLSPSEKKKSLLFIPHSNKLYWDFFASKPRFPDCMKEPFIAPVITGIAMLDGLPEMGCITWAYGYLPSAYKNLQLAKQYENRFVRRRPQLDQIAVDMLCSATFERGFAKLILMEESSSHNIILSKIACSTDGNHIHRAL